MTNSFYDSLMAVFDVIAVTASIVGVFGALIGLVWLSVQAHKRWGTPAKIALWIIWPTMLILGMTVLMMYAGDPTAIATGTPAVPKCRVS